ncbi:MAG: J domain-containing protein [Moorea sp. SIO2I5]|nr:J domain-containing protein [Moorena sp. SIO2I5]
MSDSNHYQTLDVHPHATTLEIKQAYRRLAKRFHPDSNSPTADPEKIIQVNAAYEVLSNPERRRSYDQKRNYFQDSLEHHNRQQRTAHAQRHYQHHRQKGKKTDAQLGYWLQQIYQPVNHRISHILEPLEAQLDELSADPFDDELMAEFEAYLEECGDHLHQAQSLFHSQPNPATVASAAANLYYCLNQLADGIEELKLFTLNYDDYHLHTGQELFRIASHLLWEAKDTVKDFW